MSLAFSRLQDVPALGHQLVTRNNGTASSRHVLDQAFGNFKNLMQHLLRLENEDCDGELPPFLLAAC